MLNKLHRPKWQHKDPDVRQQAIAKLDPGKAEDISILSELAQKDDAEHVRTAAIKQLRDMRVLVEIVQAKPPQQDKEVAVQQIRQLLSKPSSTNGKTESSNKALLQSIFELNESELSPQEVAKIALESEVGLYAFERIKELKDFIELVQSAKQVKVKLAAMEKIDSAADLKSLLKSVSDKSVLQIIREKLKQHKAREDEHAQQLAEAEKTCATIEKLAPLPFDERYAIRLQKQIDSWQLIDATIRAPLQARFDSAKESCKSTIAKYDAEKQQRQQIADAKAKQIDLSQKMDALSKSLAENVSTYDESVLTEALSDFAQQWQTASKLSEAPQTNAKIYYKAIEAIDTYRHARAEYQTRERELSQQLESFLSDNKDEKQPDYKQANAAVKMLRELKQSVKWPIGYEKPDLLNRLEANYSDWQEKLNRVIKANKNKTEQIHKKTSVLQKEIQKRNLISANRLYNYINKQVGELDQHYKEKEAIRLSKVDESLNELRDWHQFATEPKKEALCAQIEALLEQQQDPMERAEQIKQLQMQWKELNSSNSEIDQALWERFKTASDKAFEPCLAYYAERDSLRAENLKKRMSICDQLETFLQTIDWANVDWKKVETVEKQARNEWALYTPVPNKETKPIQKRFDISAKQIKEKLDIEREKNLEERKELVAKATALSEQEDLFQAIEQAMALQKQWKTLGITFFRQDQKQWKKFRAACNKVFERRDEERVANKEKLQLDITRSEEIIAHISAYQKLSDEELVKEKQSLAELRREFNQIIRLIPIKQSKKLKSNFNDVSKRIDAQLAGVSERKELNRFAALEAIVELCEQQEHGNSSEQTQATLDELFERLYKKYQLAIKPRLDGSQQHSALSREEKERRENQNLSVRQRLFLELEVLLDIASPEEFKSDRMAYQLEQLQQGLQAKLNDVERRDKTQALLLSWIAAGPVPEEAKAGMVPRYEAIRKAVFC